MSKLGIVLFTDSPARFPAPTQYNLTVHRTNSALSQLPDSISFFLLDQVVSSNARTLLSSLRQTPQYALIPFFLLESIDPFLDACTDGTVGSIKEAVQKADKINTFLTDLGLDLVQYCSNTTFRVLAYCYCRTMESICPLKDWTHAKIYSFPLLEVLTGLQEGLGDWIDNTIARGFFLESELFDRVRFCPKCEFSHLNFIDVCPHCNSEKIRQTPFFHCFTCGTVAMEEKFFLGNTMVCPQCRARLRHIGVDYDRAIEEYTCDDCNSYFDEAKVVANCFNCANRTDPADLPIRQISCYSLTEKAMIAVKTGVIEKVSVILDDLQNLTYDHFIFQLNWFLLYTQRYPGDKFSVIGIAIANIEELYDELGRIPALELVEEYTRRLKEQIRETDFTARSGLYELWILFPHTEARGRNTIVNRVRAAIEATRHSEGKELQLEMVEFTAPEDVLQNEDGRRLAMRLQVELGHSFTENITI